MKLKLKYVEFPTVIAFLIGALVSFTIMKIQKSSQDHSPNTYALGVKAMGAKQFDQALKYFEATALKFPESPHPHFGTGWALQTKGDLNGAVAEYQKSIDSASDVLSRSFFNLGVIQQQRKNFAEALKSYESVLKVNSKFIGASYNLAFVYSDLNQTEQALKLFLEAGRVEPTNASARYYAGQMSERLSNRSEALIHYKDALKISPNLKEAVERMKALKGK